MADRPVDMSEILVAPLGEMIGKIGQGVAEAQRQLDAAALAGQRAVETQDELRGLRDIGYKVSWYQMPEVTVELRIAMHYEQTGGEKKGLLISLFNAKYQNKFAFSADGTSTLKIRIVPCPPPVVETAG